MPGLLILAEVLLQVAIGYWVSAQLSYGRAFRGRNTDCFSDCHCNAKMRSLL